MSNIFQATREFIMTKYQIDLDTLETGLTCVRSHLCPSIDTDKLSYQ